MIAYIRIYVKTDISLTMWNIVRIRGFFFVSTITGASISKSCFLLHLRHQSSWGVVKMGLTHRVNMIYCKTREERQ